MDEINEGDFALHYSGGVVKVNKLYIESGLTQSWADFTYRVGDNGFHIGSCFLSNLSPLPKSCQYLYA